MNKLLINEIDYLIIKDILAKYPYQFYAYGSRTKGTAKKYSDLDLCYLDNISRSEILNLNEELIESDLSFRVDLINLNKADLSFKKSIQKDLILLN
jgi:predicted nucleotidyltransferase